MHCPKCGTAIESDDVRFCSRCGFTLSGVRAVMEAEERGDQQIDVSVGGVNLGVVLMFVAVLPALLAVLTSPIAIPAALLYLSIVYIAILLVSGQLLKLFHAGNAPPSEGMIRRRRKEIAFGSTLMFIDTLLATFLVAAAVPDAWARIALMTLIPATFVGLLLSSRWLFGSFRELTSSGNTLATPKQPSGELTTGGLSTGDLDAAQVDVPSNTRQLEFADKSPSVTEGTTRQLEKAR